MKVAPMKLCVKALRQCLAALPDDTEVRIALDKWADTENPQDREVLRSTYTVHFLEIRPRQTYGFLFLVHSEPEESEEHSNI